MINFRSICYCLKCFFLVFSNYFLISCDDQLINKKQTVFSSAELDNDKTPVHVGLPNDVALNMALISWSREKKKSFCSGILIHKDWMLTAAHCYLSEDAEITLGPDIFGNRSTAKINFIEKHPSLDVMLINVRLNSFLNIEKIICSEICELATNQKLIYAGYRLKEDNDFKRLRFDYSILSKVNDDSIETASKDNWENCCRGDSGGPLFQLRDDRHFVLVGILSAVSINCNDRCVYVRIGAVEKWISEIVDQFTSQTKVSY